MRSKHMIGNAAVLVACVTATLLAGSSGCQRRKLVPDAVAPPPQIAVDEAMRKRDWPAQSAFYADTSIIATPTGFLYEPEHDRAEWNYIFLDTGTFLGNTVLLPVAFIMNPPWRETINRGATIPPTYTAVPPLPPSDEAATPEYVPVAPEPVERTNGRTTPAPAVQGSSTALPVAPRANGAQPAAGYSGSTPAPAARPSAVRSTSVAPTITVTPSPATLPTTRPMNK
jgi:hypothetical protein